MTPYAKRLLKYAIANLVNMVIGANNPVRIVLPEKYAVTEKLLIGIVDDDEVYDCKFTDGVLGELVDPRAFI